jgi:bleomycin hydrolase
MQELTKEQIAQYQMHYGHNRNTVIANAIAKNEIQSVVINGDVLYKTQNRFSNEVKTLKATNQKSSGRCWIFAGLNIIRESVAQRLNLEDIELSQNFVAFYDKLEKINYFLESILDTVGEDAQGRLVNWIIQTGISDGGQWDMFVSLLEKYGVVPKDAMPETYHSGNTGSLNRLLNTKLRKDACLLREMQHAGAAMTEIRAEKDRMVRELYALLCMCFGTPPERFVWEYRDKDGQFSRKETSALDFYRTQVGDGLAGYVSVINAPTDDKPFNRVYTVRYLGNVVGGRDILYVNTDIATLKQAALEQLLDNEAVWFGSDVGKGMDKETGLLDTELYDWNGAFNMDFSMSKKDRLDYRESCMNHAMVITGVNLADGKPDRWKIQNSWGEDKGDKGYYVMTDRWFEEYVYQIVIQKKYLPDSLRAAMEEEPIVLDPWDPMGSLA